MEKRSLRKSRKSRLRGVIRRFSSNPVSQLFERALYTVNPEPILVLGNQKAGTSAIAHLLADCCDLSKTVDIPELWPPAIVRILKGEDSLASLARRHPKSFSRDLIKEPHLTFVYPQVTELWPHHRCVFVIRDPRKNIRSVLNRLRIPGNLREFDAHDSDMPEAWKPIFAPEIWGSDSNHYITVLADRWRQAALVYVQQPEKMILVRYEDFLSAKVQRIEGLAVQLGLRPVNDISARVDIQYQPKGDHSISLVEFFGRDHLRMIDKICQEEMSYFDYRCYR